MKNCKIIAEFSIFPIGINETSISRYIAKVLDAIKDVKGINYKITPMGTILEANKLEIILEAVKVAHETLISKGILRIESTLRIDDRRDKPRRMKDKVDSVKEKMQQN